MRFKWGLILFVCVCFCRMGIDPNAVVAQAEKTESAVQVIGFSTVYSENADAARNQAVSNSLVTAVDQAVSELIPLKTKIEQFKLLNQILYGQPGKFVLGYKVLTEAMSGKEYRVLVEAIISKDMLKAHLADAGLSAAQSTAPKILLLIAEQNIEDIDPFYWWGEEAVFFEGACETRMAEVLNAQGVQVIPHGRGMPTGAAEQKAVIGMPSGPNPSDSEALALGKQFEADVVIVALAKAMTAGNVMGETYKSYKGEISGRALRTGTGEKIEEIYKSAVAMDADATKGGRQALMNVGAVTAEMLGPRLTAAWQTKPAENMTVTMTVEGTRKLENFVKFRNLLHELPMVANVETSSIKPNEATLLVDLKGETPRGLADAVMLKSFDAFGINISSITEDDIHLSLVPK